MTCIILTISWFGSTSSSTVVKIRNSVEFSEIPLDSRLVDELRYRDNETVGSSIIFYWARPMVKMVLGDLCLFLLPVKAGTSSMRYTCKAISKTQKGTSTIPALKQTILLHSQTFAWMSIHHAVFFHLTFPN